MTRVAFPYRRPSADIIRADVWMLADGDDVREAPPYLDGWDYNTELKLRREVRIDVATVRAQAMLAPHAPVALAVGAFSSSTWLRQRCFHRCLLNDTEEVVIDLTLGGGDLGGNLRLQTAVVLEGATASRTAFAAHLPASILWDDRYEIRLQGDAPLFPISVVDFELAGFAAGAGWHLEIGSDLDAPLHASIRLYLNRADTVVVGAFARAGAPAPEDKPVLRAVFADVARVMVEHALNRELLRETSEWNPYPDSLGFALQRLLRRYFAQADLDAVRLHRIEHPSDFSTELFAQIGVFVD